MAQKAGIWRHLHWSRCPKSGQVLQSRMNEFTEGNPPAAGILLRGRAVSSSRFWFPACETHTELRQSTSSKWRRDLKIEWPDRRGRANMASSKDDRAKMEHIIGECFVKAANIILSSRIDQTLRKVPKQPSTKRFWVCLWTARLYCPTASKGLLVQHPSQHCIDCMLLHFLAAWSSEFKWHRTGC